MAYKQPITKYIVLNGSGTNAGVTEVTVNNSASGLMIITGNDNNLCGSIPFYIINDDSYKQMF